MPLNRWKNLNFMERQKLRRLAELAGLPTDDESLDLLLTDCRETALGKTTSAEFVAEMRKIVNRTKKRP